MMINNDNELLKQNQPEPKEETSQPDEHPGVAIQGFLKIFDPESGEIFAQGRV
jgi:hypothetical protein